MSELWSLKCQKWLIFVFSADDSKKLVTVRVTFLSAPEKPYRVLSENCMLLGLGVTVCEILGVEMSKNGNGSSEPNNP